MKKLNQAYLFAVLTLVAASPSYASKSKPCGESLAPAQNVAAKADLKTFASNYSKRFNQVLVEKLRNLRVTENHADALRLIDSMLFSLESGGKRVRPLLVALVGRSYNLRPETLDPIATAVEMLHTSSLILDDLPMMDNSDLRRGRMANHRQFDEQTATLASVSLIAHAGIALTTISDQGFDEKLSIAVHRFAFSQIHPLAAGQLRDLRSTQAIVGPEVLEEMTYLKTGLGLETSIVSAAILGGASEDEIVKWRKFSRVLGQIFQLKDDLLDVDGNPAATGKPTQIDERNNTLTYVKVYGLSQARDMLETLRDQAIAALAEIQIGDSAYLEALVDYIVKRDR